MHDAVSLSNPLLRLRGSGRSQHMTRCPLYHRLYSPLPLPLRAPWWVTLAVGTRAWLPACPTASTPSTWWPRTPRSWRATSVRPATAAKMAAMRVLSRNTQAQFAACRVPLQCAVCSVRLLYLSRSPRRPRPPPQRLPGCGGAVPVPHGHRLRLIPGGGQAHPQAGGAAVDRGGEIVGSRDAAPLLK